ncbi:tRNA (adenosine(37)-N6)-threonylcarbamoyltransferase complex dimerization subunit type 1 TsaB [Aquimarina sp. U1-2]|uniref:tRNA (adenosine(37)-N6)-threonylcarbamoyltransferase complex dimerization subunit type 1 TsaB n=1 Tax=Aquimarina sp. U1-2 TaxID=2823141 RepID=UPI001AECF0A1|nr:tRNA (adenosine(37)-N6)-threonylcarbamoyltransferase complex dimerization subunit type 1 TsaB [Aquimarina sp. U1-2]MBP2832491.1 tRNA (adenosine(37)-N6)-threonylcarbamoyltransferase complex dimerization subunit type 1 TsaB [Aquimarina sp. U1-2]
MAFILCIETSTTNCSVALTNDEDVIAIEEDISKQYSHAEQLHVFINKVINDATIGLKDISAVAISKGPGSYTGLRIGVSAAKGLCYALDIPLISVPTLQSLSLQVQLEDKDALIVPMLDARRMEVYAGVYSYLHEEVREIRAEVLTEHSFSEYVASRKVYFLGNGADKFSTLLQHQNAIFLKNKFPSARDMAKLSFLKFRQADFEDVGYFEPFYLKDFITS